MGADEGFFGHVFCSGSHLNSIAAVVRGEVDAAAIDSNVLNMRLKELPELREKVRAIESWGPFPIQRVVVRSALPEELKKRLRASLLRLDPRALSEFGLQRLVPVTVEDYRSLWDDGGEGGGEERSAILVAKVSGRNRMGRT